MPQAFGRPTTTSRRQFVASCLAAGAVPVMEACSEGQLPSYEEAAADMRRPIALAGKGEAARLRDLVRQATLAASSHNTQPWKFMLAERSITILPDLTRRTPVVDPDDHHLFVSLGCAAENLVHAALASGLHPEVRLQGNAVEVAFDETTPVRSPLFEAIPARQCSRSIYDGQPLAAKELRALEDVTHGDGVHAIMLTSTPQIETVLDYVTRGNTTQIGDPAFVAELKAWIRFSEDEALRRAMVCSPVRQAIPLFNGGLEVYCSARCSPRGPRMTSVRSSFAVPPVSSSSCRTQTIHNTGSRSAAATSASPCRRLPSGSARRS
jgi:hypothetical protein